MSIRVFESNQAATDRCIWLVGKSTALRMAGDREDAYPLADFKWIERKAIQRCTRAEMQERRRTHAEVARELRAREVADQGMPGDLPPSEVPGVKFILRGRIPPKVLFAQSMEEFTERQCWGNWAAGVK